MLYTLDVTTSVVEPFGEAVRIRRDTRTVANNAKPNEQWDAMIRETVTAILIDWSARNPSHPFDGLYMIRIARSDDAPLPESAE